jgi:hypothetical protein
VFDNVVAQPEQGGSWPCTRNNAIDQNTASVSIKRLFDILNQRRNLLPRGLFFRRSQHAAPPTEILDFALIDYWQVF